MPDSGLDHVTVAYDDRTVALDRVTLRARDGELLVVLGPSGSGKSTVLRAIAGLVPVRSGDVLINGKAVTRVPVERRGVAMVFESSSLVPFLDVAGNLAWGLRARHVPEAEVAERTSRQARELRLTRLLPRMPRTLSAGEYARVGIGRAMVQLPAVFLLDEPLAHLDAADRLRLRRRIVELVRASGVTTLYVTHDQADASAVADRIAVLDAGTIVQLGTPRELYRRPANVFVAGFIGTPPMGFLPARVVVSAGSAGYRVGARTLPLWTPAPDALRGSIDQPVVLGVRPEDVYDATEGCDPELVPLAAIVVGVEHTGPEKLVTLELFTPPLAAPGADLADAGAAGARLRARFAASSTVRPGSMVQVAVDVARAHVFDPATGQALWHPTDVADRTAASPG